MANPAQEEQRMMETLYSGTDKIEKPNTKGRISPYENSLPDDDTSSESESDSPASSYTLQPYSVLTAGIRSDPSSITDFEYDVDLNENRSEDSNSFVTNTSFNGEYFNTVSSNDDDINYYDSDDSSMFPTNSLFDDTYDADFQSEDEIEMSHSEDEIQKYNFSFEE